jgi:putative sugar O-methyltransferase
MGHPPGVSAREMVEPRDKKRIPEMDPAEPLRVHWLGVVNPIPATESAKTSTDNSEIRDNVNLKLLFHPARLAAAINRRLRRSWRLSVRSTRKRLADNPAYRTDLVPAGFALRQGDQSDDTALLRRICDAYIKAKECQRTASETYKVSNEWLPIYERPLRPVMDALAKSDINALRRMYQNYYRDPCSTGLTGLPVADMNKCYFRGEIAQKYRHLVLCDVLHRHELWKQETKNAYSIRDLTSPDIGNPCGFFIEGVFLKGGSDYQHYYATKIRSLLSQSDRQVVVELGGGFGGMAYYFIRDNPEATYIDFDLPENLALASYYLLKAFPEASATLFGEADLTPETLRSSRIVLMPSFEIQKLQDKSVSVSFNSYSLAEMSGSAIKEYIAHITRITKGHFLHVNHTRNAVVNADNFGVEQHGFKLLERRVAGWTLGINRDADEFQFLYEANRA